MIGWTDETQPGMTGDYHTDLRLKAQHTISCLNNENYVFGFLHVKAVDDAGHDSNLPLKITFLGKIDEMLGEIIQSDIEGNVTVVITGDHSTPVMYGDHSYEPVPFVICKVADVRKNGLKYDWVEKFSECEAGRLHSLLGRFPGSEVKHIIKTFLEN